MRVVALLLTIFLLSSVSRESKILELDLHEAIAQNVISWQGLATGNYDGESIKAKIKNLSRKKVRILIPAGTYFRAEATDEQNLVTTEDLIVELNPSSGSSKVLNGFCFNASKRCPGEGKAFTPEKKTNEELVALTKFLKGKKYDNDVLQSAVWTISDRRSISSVYGKDQDAILALREELSKITGLKNPWYSSPERRSLDRNRNINRETVMVHGDIRFECPEGAKVHQEIRDAAGNVKAKDEETPLRAGNVRYRFNVQVRGWERGTYFVKLMNGDQELVSREFEI
ncbi:MAG: hypothetical protein EP338_05050 [Bacteroidetes bacterium]|nr:MAG: hypothetical protein EP338_05050 [Bacteroidota bacterium]